MLLISSVAFCQDSLSVLFIGNSYVYTNDLPTVFKNLTLSLGDNALVDSKTNGGFTFQNHVNDPLTFQKINAQNWDYVVLQGQSQEPSFPYGQVNSATLPYAVQLADSVKSNYLCSQVNYFMTWGRQVGDPQWDSINTFDKMNLRLRNAYIRIADSSKSGVTPAGVAWKYVIDNHPTINLFSSDGSHPNIAGTYLTACTFYASLFHKSPVGSTYWTTLDQTTAEILQNVASLVVLDSLSEWRLKHLDSLVVSNFSFVNSNPPFEFQFSNQSEYSTDYFWSFGDGVTSSLENPTHVYNSPGIYQIDLIGNSICGADTTVQFIEINTNNIDEQSNIQWDVFQNEAGLIVINSDFKIEKKDIIIYNSLGQKCSFEILETQGSLIKIKSDTSGILFINIESQNISFHKTIFVK